MPPGVFNAHEIARPSQAALGNDNSAPSHSCLKQRRSGRRDRNPLSSFAKSHPARRFDDPKISFYRTVKDIEKQLADPDVKLSSFIISNTRLEDITWRGDKNRDDFGQHNVLFQQEDKENYIPVMMEKIFS